MSIALTGMAAQRRGCIAIAALPATFASLALCPRLTLITLAHALCAGRVIVAATTDATIAARPAQLTVAHIIRWPRALAMLTELIAGASTCDTSVANITTSAMTIVATLGVCALGLLVAIVQSQPAFIHIRTLCIGPFGIVLCAAVQCQRTVASTVAKVALHANTLDGIVAIKAPATAQGAQAGGAVPMPFT